MQLNKVQATVYHPSLMEINTRVWLRRYDQEGRKATLADIPNSFWDYLANKKMDYLWLMGVWKLADSAIESYAFEAGLVENYRSALENWTPEDVIGSPYAIDQYILNPLVGTTDDLKKVKKELNKRGIKLILDFVPNHFSAHSTLIDTNPELFLQGDAPLLATDPVTYYEYQDKVFAHGKDPYFDGWQDTVQVNYFHAVAREFMQQTLLDIATLCDGVRVDMAMLALNEIFAKTWQQHVDYQETVFPQEEFWKQAITALREEHPDFLLIAETYWDLEWSLQQLGFNYTYDKTLTDRLLLGNAQSIHSHLKADFSYQNSLVRFLENHDEERAMTSFGETKSKAAAIIAGTIPGMRFYYLGQLEGRRISIPVQLGREPEEAHCPCVAGSYLRVPNQTEQWKEALRPICSCTYLFYDKLLDMTQDPVFKNGTWRLATQQQASPGVLAWQWQWEEAHRLVVVNYSDQPGQSRIRIDWEADQPFFATDLISNQQFQLAGDRLNKEGLPLQMSAYWSWILKYEAPQKS